MPDRWPLPVDVAQPPVTAMPYDDQRKSFFVAPLPGLFHKLAGPDQARNLDELFLGLAAHELTHTRHYAHAMPQITRLRLRYKLPESFDDNIIQQEFGASDDYKKLYDAKRTLLTKAILARDLDDCRQAVGGALLASQKRKDRFFVGDKAGVLESRRHLSGDGRAGDVRAVPGRRGAGAIGSAMAEDVDHALGGGMSRVAGARSRAVPFDRPACARVAGAL